MHVQAHARTHTHTHTNYETNLIASRMMTHKRADAATGEMSKCIHTHATLLDGADSHTSLVWHSVNTNKAYRHE